MTAPPPYERHAEALVREALEDTRVVVLQGPRQAGKSTLAEEIAGSVPGAALVTLDDDAVLAAARSDPATFVRRKGLLVIDEVQRAPELLLAIKAEVDRRKQPGRFLLTGSAHVLSLLRLSDSLAGRMETVALLPLSQGEIRGRRERLIDRLFAAEDGIGVRSSLDRRAIVEIAVAGGFPEALTRRTARRRARWFAEYTETLLRRDVRDLSDVERPAVLRRLLRVLAARTADLLNADGLGRDVRLPATTLRRYLALLEALFLVETLPPWESNRTLRAMKTPKVHVIDSGLAAHLIGVSAEALAEPVSDAGQIVESFAVGEIRKQVSWSDVRPSMHHYRSRDGAEVDVVLEAPDGRVVGIEVKAGATVTARDFAGLRHVAARAGRKFVAGVVLYTGAEPLPFGDRMRALPMENLWSA